MSDIQQLCDRLRAMFIPASLQLELKPRLSREDAEEIITYIASIGRDLAAAREELERERKPWRFHLITTPVPRQQAPGDYPDLSETYDLSLVDTGHSERVYLLGSNELDKRLMEAEKQLAAANATVAQCKAVAESAIEREKEKDTHGDAFEVCYLALKDIITAAEAAREGKVQYAKHICDHRCGDDGHHAWPSPDDNSRPTRQEGKA